METILGKFEFPLGPDASLHFHVGIALHFFLFAYIKMKLPLYSTRLCL